MSHASSLYTQALSVEETVSRMVQAAPIAFPDQQVHLEVGTSVGGLRFSVDTSASAIAKHPAVLQFLNQIRGRSHILCTQCLLYASNNSSYHLNYTTEDGVIARIYVQAPGDAAVALQYVEAIEKNFKVTTYVDIVRASSPAVDQAAITLRERSVADLRETMKELAAFQAKMFEEEVESRRKYQAELDASHKDRLDKLDKEYRDRLTGLDNRKAALDTEDSERTRAFNEKEARFNLQEFKAMRRVNEGKFDRQLAVMETSNLSQSTEKKRWWVHGAVWSVAVVGLGFAASSMVLVYKAQTIDWHLFVPLSGGFVAFVATMIYYFKWNDRYYREHADAEFAAKRYRADFMRAAWVTEFIQEWAKEGKGELPPALISAYTQNLFRGVSATEVSEHPIDSLSSLVKDAKRVDVGKGFVSIRKFDSKQ